MCLSFCLIFARSKLSFMDLAQYFGLPFRDAANQLDLHYTQLQRQCRSVGISEWPYKDVCRIMKEKEKAGKSVAKCLSIKEIDGVREDSTYVEESLEWRLGDIAVPWVERVELKKLNIPTSNVMPMPSLLTMVSLSISFTKYVY